MTPHGKSDEKSRIRMRKYESQLLVSPYLSSSAISEQRLWWSICEFFLEFQQNSSTATIMASVKPHKRTTNTPPIFLTLKGFALESLLLS